MKQEHRYIKPVSNPQKRRRSSLDLSEPSLTDQSFKESCNINTIMAQYAKTGMLPSFGNAEPQFLDLTDYPDLNTAYNIVVKAQEAFETLPAIVRKAMDNDASKLESFIADSNNQKFLMDNGVLTERKKPVKPTTLTPQDIENLGKTINHKVEKTA